MAEDKISRRLDALEEESEEQVRDLLITAVTEQYTRIGDELVAVKREESAYTEVQGVLRTGMADADHGIVRDPEVTEIETMRHRVIRRSPVVDDLRELVLGDLERMYHDQQVELQSILFDMTPEEAELKFAEDCRAALEASTEERERERLRRRRLAVKWIAEGRGLR